MAYTINVYNAKGDLSQTCTATTALDAVTVAYTFVRDRVDWAAHIIQDGTLGGLYIARWDDFSYRGAKSYEQCAVLLEVTSGNSSGTKN